MAVFLHEDVKQLLYNKFVVMIGDSVVRGMYKDLVALLQGNYFLSRRDLKVKGEESFMKDKLLEGGTKAVMNNGVNYREVREYKTDTHLVRFYFVTRVHNSYWREVIFRDLSEEPSPDVVLLNSTLWDISRYGSVGMSQFKENLEKTLMTLAEVIPRECVCIWNTALPVAKQIRGGFLLPELAPLMATLRLDVLEANFYARKLAEIFDINVLDLNYFFRSLMDMQVHQILLHASPSPTKTIQAGDGVHWNFRAHRRFTNYLLEHLCKSWSIKLPHKGEELMKKTPCPSLTMTMREEEMRTPTPPGETSRHTRDPRPRPPPRRASRWDELPKPWAVDSRPRDYAPPPVGVYNQATDSVLHTDFSDSYRPQPLLQQPVSQPQVAAHYNQYFAPVTGNVGAGHGQSQYDPRLGQGRAHGLGQTGNYGLRQGSNQGLAHQLGADYGLGHRGLQMPAAHVPVSQDIYHAYAQQQQASYQNYQTAAGQVYSQWCNTDSSTRRQQRIMAERAHEVAGVVHYAGQQYRVQ